MSVIDVKNLSMNYKYLVRENSSGTQKGKRFKRVQVNKLALDNISFSVQQGDVIGYVGLNGAGKTTTMKILSGILSPTQGYVEVLGYKPFDKKQEYLKKICLIMGNKCQLYWDLPVIDTINFNKAIYDVEDKIFKQYYEMMVNLLDVEHLLYTQVRRLSLGERMKIELIAALIHHPNVIFLDEPTIGLDIIAQNNIRKFLKSINKEWGCTIILTSHNIDDISEVCNKLILIENGKLCYEGLLEDFLRKYGNKNIIIKVNGSPEKIVEHIAKSQIKIKKVDYNHIYLETASQNDLNEIKDVWGAFINSITDICIENNSLKEIISDVLRKNP